MNIFVVSDVDPQGEASGAERVLTAHCLGLAKRGHKVFLIAGTRFLDMARTVIEIVGSGELEMVPWPEDYFHIETGDYVFDIGQIHRVLNWKPVVSLPDGVSMTYDFYKKHRDRYWDRA